MNGYLPPRGALRALELGWQRLVPCVSNLRRSAVCAPFRTRKRSATGGVVRSGPPPRALAGEVEERILDAAAKVFLERSFEGANVDEIADVAVVAAVHTMWLAARAEGIGLPASEIPRWRTLLCRTRSGGKPAAHRCDASTNVRVRTGLSRWREMDSNHRSLSRESRFILRKVNCGRIDGAAKTFCGYRWFESISVQRRESVSRPNPLS